VDVWDNVIEGAETVINFFKELPGKIWDAVKGIASVGRDIAINIARGVSEKIGDILGWFRDLPRKIGNLFTNAATSLASVGRDLIVGLWNGLVGWFNESYSLFRDVAGSILGSGAKSNGPLKGGAYDASIVAESMWSPMLGGLSVPSKMGDLFGQAYDLGARIHTNSWGSPSSVGAYDAFAQKTDEFNVSHPEMLILFAAGNSGVDADKDGRIDGGSIGSPGTAKNVLTVGASENLVSKGGIQKMMKEMRNGAENWGVEPIASSRLSDNVQGIAAFSSRGPTADGRIKPEIVAPGTNILSVRSQVVGSDPLWGAYNDAYVWSGGTSMSTPLTAGAAAVVRQYLVENRKMAQPSGALMKATLIHTATELFPGQFGSVGKAKGQELVSRRPNNDEGFGRVDVD
ncbi:MAG: S8 family serine peptidase, partial [Bdellovibrionota bacterium]